MAGGVGHHLAHHFADQQIRQKPAFAAAADDDQVAALLHRLLHDLLVGLFAPAQAQVDRHTHAGRLFAQLRQS